MKTTRYGKRTYNDEMYGAREQLLSVLHEALKSACREDWQRTAEAAQTAHMLAQHCQKMVNAVEFMPSVLDKKAGAE